MAKDSTHGRVFGPTVAGRFYPDDPKRLRASVESYLEQGKKNASIPPDRRLVALVAPHAGYVYSGPVAGVALPLAKMPPCATSSSCPQATTGDDPTPAPSTRMPTEHLLGR